jgi:hypothetical protein
LKQRVYLETTIVSYLTARPSRDMLLAVHQDVTRIWWEERRKEYELYISDFVLTEAAGGEPEMAKRRLALLKGIRQLPVTDQLTELGKAIITEGVLPSNARIDAFHVAAASVHDMDVLLTWNCRHLANVDLLGRLGRYLSTKGFEMPIITTPEELMGGY